MTGTAASIPPTAYQMPKPVWVSLAMLALQVPVGLIDFYFFEPVEFGIIFLALTVVVTLLALGLIALLAMGYGWIRHLYVVGAVLSLPRLVLLLPQLFQSSPMHGAWILAMNLWFYAAVALLYLPSARAWFHDARLRRQRGL